MNFDGIATVCVFAWEERARESSAHNLEQIRQYLAKHGGPCLKPVTPACDDLALATGNLRRRGHDVTSGPGRGPACRPTFRSAPVPDWEEHITPAGGPA